MSIFDRKSVDELIAITEQADQDVFVWLSSANHVMELYKAAGGFFPAIEDRLAGETKYGSTKVIIRCDEMLRMLNHIKAAAEVGVEQP